jgi:hypothetical protein
MSKRKPVARIVFEQYRDEYVITADAPVDVLVIDHTWPDKPHRVLHHPAVSRNTVDKQFSELRKRCPACKHSTALCICQRIK